MWHPFPDGDLHSQDGEPGAPARADVTSARAGAPGSQPLAPGASYPGRRARQ